VTVSGQERSRSSAAQPNPARALREAGAALTVLSPDSGYVMPRSPAGWISPLCALGAQLLERLARLRQVFDAHPAQHRGRQPLRPG